VPFAAILLAVLAAPAVARAAPLKRFATGIARTEGERFVVVSRRSLSDPDGVPSVTVFDERTRQTRTLPDGCPTPAVGSGFLLAACSDRPWRVFDLARGTDQAIAPIPWRPPNGNDEPINSVPQIGSRWMVIDQAHTHAGTERRFEDWRTGRVLREPGATSFPDLDRPALARPLCRPLRRPFDSWANEFGDYQYERPYGVRTTSDATLLLDRCGRRRATMLAHTAASAQLAGGILTWLTIHPAHGRRPWRYIVHARMLRTGRTAIWRLTLRPPRDVASVQHTASAVYATVGHGDTSFVLRAALPPT
jgi:hypothetical protein